MNSGAKLNREKTALKKRNFLESLKFFISTATVELVPVIIVIIIIIFSCSTDVNCRRNNDDDH
jgi:hypothetical protein